MGAVLCKVGCSAESLASTYQVLVATPTALRVLTVKTYPDFAKCPVGAGPLLAENRFVEPTGMDPRIGISQWEARLPAELGLRDYGNLQSLVTSGHRQDQMCLHS